MVQTITVPEGSSIAYLDRKLREVEQVNGRGPQRQRAPRSRARVASRSAEVNIGRVMMPLTSGTNAIAPAKSLTAYDDARRDLRRAST